MKLQYFLPIVFISYANSCLSVEMMERPSEQKKAHHAPSSKTNNFTEVEQQAIERANSNNLTQQDIEEGIKMYRKITNNNPDLKRKSFDIYENGMISIDNYL